MTAARCGALGSITEIKLVSKEAFIHIRMGKWHGMCEY